MQHKNTLTDGYSLEDAIESIRSKVALGSNIDASQEKRKEKRLDILKTLLYFILAGMAISATVTLVIYFGTGATATPPELIVLNTILGSSLTTIIGVIAGTSID